MLRLKSLFNALVGRAFQARRDGDPERVAPRTMRNTSIRNTSLILLLCLATLTAAGAELTLVDAVKAANRDAVRAILATPRGKAAVNTAEPDGTTPLHWAVRADEAAMVRTLIAAGANVNAVNRYGVTP